MYTHNYQDVSTLRVKTPKKLFTRPVKSFSFRREGLSARHRSRRRTVRAVRNDWAFAKWIIQYFESYIRYYRIFAEMIENATR